VLFSSTTNQFLSGGLCPTASFRLRPTPSPRNNGFPPAIGGEAPVDGTDVVISILFPSRDFFSPQFDIGDSAIDTLGWSMAIIFRLSDN
jgi:hypothetical protein